MTKYIELSIHLSKTQRQQIAYAVQHNSTVRLKFTKHQLFENPNNVKLHVTPTQYKKVQKAKSSNKGVMLTLSKKQLQYNKSGGFLGPILGALVGSLAPMLFQRIFPDNREGSGIKMVKTRKYQQNDNEAEGFNLPGTGISLPGTGIYLDGSHNNRSIRPANGENMSSHLVGNHSSYLPDSYINLQNTTYKPLKSKIIKRGKGLTDNYINPQSERFQMLK